MESEPGIYSIYRLDIQALLSPPKALLSLPKSIKKAPAPSWRGRSLGDRPPEPVPAKDGLRKARKHSARQLADRPYSDDSVGRMAWQVLAHLFETIRRAWSCASYHLIG